MKKQYILTEEEYQALVNEKSEQRSKFDYVLNTQLAEIKRYRGELNLIIEMIDGKDFWQKSYFTLEWLNRLSSEQKLVEIKGRIQSILHLDSSKYKHFSEILQQLKNVDNKVMLKKQLKLEKRGYSAEEIEKIVQDIIDSYTNL
jgi:hypothetical protein